MENKFDGSLAQVQQAKWLSPQMFQLISWFLVAALYNKFLDLHLHKVANSLPEYLGRCHMDEVVAEEEVRPHYRCSGGMALSEGVCSQYRSAMIWWHQAQHIQLTC